MKSLNIKKLILNLMLIIAAGVFLETASKNRIKRLIGVSVFVMVLFAGALFSLAANPLLSIELLKTVEVNNGRPEIIATNDRVYVVCRDNTTEEFKVIIYDKDMEGVISTKILVSSDPTTYGIPTDIRIISDGAYVYAFYETAKKKDPLETSKSYLFGAKYTLNDDFTRVAYTEEPIADSTAYGFQSGGLGKLLDGTEITDDPAPLMDDNYLYVITRIKYSLKMAGNTIYRVRKFNKDLQLIGTSFDLDLSSIADGSARVNSVFYDNGYYYMALPTTTSDVGVNEGTDLSPYSSILAVKLDVDWNIFGSKVVISEEDYAKENYISGFVKKSGYIYLVYKQILDYGGTLPNEFNAMLKIYDEDFNLLIKEKVRSVPLLGGGMAIRPSIYVKGDKIYIGNGKASLESKVYIYEQNNSPFGSQGAIVQFPGEMNDGGIKITREWIEWNIIEPSDDVYNWELMDQKVAKANQYNIEILGYFIGTPDWAKKNPDCTSTVCELKEGYMPKFQDFVYQVAKRYDGPSGYGEMKYFEILNEVTSSLFFEQSLTNKYEDWLIAGYNGVKTGNPNAKVLIGGFVHPLDVTEFIDRMVKDYSSYYDIVSFHVYENEQNVTDATDYLKGRMDFYGVYKPMWLTETATVFPPSESGWEDKIAKDVIKRYARAFSLGVEKVFWWPFVGEPTISEYPPQTKEPDKIRGLGWDYPKNFGLPHEFHPRKAYYTYKLMVEKLEGSDWDNIQEIAGLPSNVHGYKFTKNGKAIWVAWWDGVGSTTIDLNISGTNSNRVKITEAVPDAASGADITNYYTAFDTRIEPVQSESVSITLTDSPVFIEAALPYEDSPFAVTIGVNTPYEGISGLGVKFARISTEIGGWEAVEPTQGQYQWPYDDIISNYYNNNINIMINVKARNNWANPPNAEGRYGIPQGENLQHYENFVEKLVERYDGDGINDALGSPIIKYFQIENEADFPGMGWIGSPEDYALLLDTAYQAIKRANPNAKVLLSGVQNPDNFNEGFFNTVLNNTESFDIFDVHIYGLKGGYKDLAQFNISFQDYLSQIRQKIGDKPIWATEVATFVGTHPAGITQTEKEQAIELLKRYVYYQSSDIEKIFWANWSVGEANYWIRNGPIPYLSYYTYKKMTEILEGSDWDNIQEIAGLPTNVYGYKFTKNGKAIWVAWNDNTSTQQITISGVTSTYIKITEAVPRYESGIEVTDYNTAFNTEIEETTQTGYGRELTVTLGVNPVFIEEPDVVEVTPLGFIQDAIDTISDFGVIRVSKGVYESYEYEEDITVDGKDVCIIGDGSLVVAINGNISVVNSNFLIEKLSVLYKTGGLITHTDGYYSDFKLTADAGITAINSRITVIDCIISPDPDIFGSTNYGKGIQLWNMYGSEPITPLIEGNEISNAETGIYLYSHSEGGVIRGEIRNNWLYDNDYGIVLRMHQENPIIDNNTIDNALVDGGIHGIHMTYSDLYTDRLNNISNNTITGYIDEIYCDELGE